MGNISLIHLKTQSETQISVKETISNEFSRFWKDISSEGVVLFSSYLFGVYSSVSKESLLISPLSTIFVAAIRGIIYTMGAGFLMAFIPPEIRVIIPFSIMMSITSDQLGLLSNDSLSNDLSSVDLKVELVN